MPPPPSLNWFREGLVTEEVWKDVVGYEGLYQVSNIGRVKSLSRCGNSGDLIRAVQLNNSGYETLMLYKDGVYKRKTVHRLVATAFLPNPNNEPQINHIDENKRNNCVSNLEWCDAKYNNSCYAKNHGKRVGKSRIVRNGKRKKLKILQMALDGTPIKVWENSRTVFLETGMSDWSVSQCCRGIWKTAYGYKWQYAN